MKINEDIWEKARKIIEEKNRFSEYISDCYIARICPKCGEQTLIIKFFNESDIHKSVVFCKSCDYS